MYRDSMFLNIREQRINMSLVEKYSCEYFGKKDEAIVLIELATTKVSFTCKNMKEARILLRKIDKHCYTRSKKQGPLGAI